MSDKWASIIAAALVCAFIAGLVALAAGASYACHRWVGPFFTGTNDPVAVAIFCRPSGGER